MLAPELLTLESLSLLEALAAPDLAGPHHEAVEAGAAAAIAAGGTVLLSLARRAVGRLVSGGRADAGHLFAGDELLLLAEALEHALVAGDGLARSLLLDRMHGLARAELGVRESRLREGTVPGAALDFFRALLAALSPARDFARRAFALAVTTSRELLGRVQDAIASRIASGQVSTGPKAVQGILDAAGVSVRNPDYASMVFRTNYMESFRRADEEQLAQSTDTFPVWKYSNPADTRSRPTHAARNGLYYPSTVPLTVVRGAAVSEAANCRCLAIAQDRRTWQALKAKGARLADGYTEAPARALALA